MPNYKNFSPHLREIFELFRNTLKAEDIKSLQEGTLFSEAFINLVFKIFEKMNLVLLAALNFQQSTPANDRISEVTQVDKVLYCTGNFMRKLRKGNSMSTEVSKLFDYDVVLVPFFYEDPLRENASTFKSNDT